MVQYQAATGEAGAPCTHDYGLPPLPPLPCPEMRGPTPWSNWVLRGRIIAGAYPASLDDAETERILTTLLELGFTTFVCLQAEFSLHTPEAAWRAGQGLRPYIKDAQKLLIRARETGSRRILQDKLDFLHLPIIDGSVTSDVALSRLADDCCTRLLRGERLYVHCWGGHGRTGTLIAVMLGRLYGITCAAALRFTQAFHDSRKFPQGVRSPQTTPQVAQVKRLLPDPPSLRGVVYSHDPSIVLDDVILRPRSPSPTRPAALSAPVRPASAASKPGALLAVPTPVAVHTGSAVDVDITSGKGKAGPAGAADVAAELADMEIDDAHILPAVPVNQQRKEAIRAAKRGGTGSSAAAAVASTGQAATTALHAALQAAGLKSRWTASIGEDIPASPAPAERQRDWLQNVFGKGGRVQGAAEAAPGSIGSGLGPGDGAPNPSPGRPASQAGYLQHYAQQQRQTQQQQFGSEAGKDRSSASRSAVFLTASSGSAANVFAPTAAPAVDAGLDMQRLDMRPSKLTIGVPAADPAIPEHSASSMQRMRSYLAGTGAGLGSGK